MKKKTNCRLLLLLLPAFFSGNAFGQLPEGAKGKIQTGRPLPYADYFMVRGGLNGFYTAVTYKKAATVAFLGGSITYNPGWRNKVCAYLHTRFPETDFRFIAAGIPSLGSLPHAFRVQRDVLDSGRIDLLFLETAVNDRVNGTDSITQVRCLEGIVRHVMRVDPDADILMMAFADEAKTADYDRGAIPPEIANQELVAGRYRLPSINFGAEVRDKIRHGEFDWKLDFTDVHPAAFGQELYFANIRQLMDTCWNLFIRAPLSPGDASLRWKMPSPIDHASVEYGRYEDIREARCDGSWILDPDWKPDDSAGTRPEFVHVPMLKASRRGARLTLAFRGTAVGMAVVSGPDAGIVEYTIDKGSWRQVDLYTPWSRWLHLPWYILFESGLPEGPHRLTLRIRDKRNPDSQGSACRIVHFLVSD